MSPRAESIRGHVISATIAVLATIATGVLMGAVRWGGATAHADDLASEVTGIDGRVSALEKSQGELRTYLVALVCHDIPEKCPLDHAP